MSTRSAIARAKGDGFQGVYHHWDGYPTQLGKTLWGLHHAHFKGDLPRMLQVLVDQHPAGWSTINGKDFKLKPGFIELGKPDNHRPQCYCHGQRHETPNPVDQNTDQGMEWAYVFDETAHAMAVLMRVHGDGDRAIGAFGMVMAQKFRWSVRGVFDLRGEEPDWEALYRGEIGAEDAA